MKIIIETDEFGLKLLEEALSLDFADRIACLRGGPDCISERGLKLIRAQLALKWYPGVVDVAPADLKGAGE